jgi:hypothetical protein
MGGIMWALRWLAAVGIFVTCIAMTVEAQMESICIARCNEKPLISQADVRWTHHERPAVREARDGRDARAM